MYKPHMACVSSRTSTGRNSRSPKTNRRKPSKKKSPQAPLWAWIVIGLLAAALVTLLIFLVNRNGSPAVISANSPKAVEPEQATPQPRFDFYEILKEREVQAPDRSGEVEAAVQTDVELFLQVASFRSTEDADQLRASLLLQNMDAFIERVDREGNQWYRVVVGPFESRSRMARARSDLASQEFNTLLIRRKVEE